MEHLLQHFRKDEQPFIEKVMDWKKDVEYRHSVKLTDFLDPREQQIVQAIVGSGDDIEASSYGAFKGAERQRMIIYPSYLSMEKEDFQIKVYSVQYPSKFTQLRHQDILGALLSLGITRNRFGDILVKDDEIQFAVSKEIADYVKMNLQMVGKVKIQLDEVDDESKFIQLDEKYIEQTLTVSSMRLDNILSTVLNMARAKAQAYIKGGKVKVNFTIREDNAFEIQEGDLISVRGFGRMKILSIEGRTNKDKVRLKVGKIV